MKGTKEDVSKEMYEVSEGIKKIADKILLEKYDPRDWCEISTKFQLICTCLQVQAFEFSKKREDIMEQL